MIMWILRGVFGALVIGVAVYVANAYFRHLQEWAALGALAGIIGIGALVIATDILVRQKEITTISAVYFGLLLGLLLGTLFAEALQFYLNEWVRPEFIQAIRLLITIVFCYVVTSTLL